MSPVTEVANVNGTILPLDRASVPVTDHGFLYGESVYETIRTYGGVPFLLERHLERLERSAAAIRLPVHSSRESMARQTSLTAEAARPPSCRDELSLRIVMTRGVGPLGYDPALCPHPNLVILARALDPPAAREIEVGVAAVVARVRRNPVAALDPAIKSSNLLNNILAAQEAHDAGAAEALLFNTAGWLAEGSITNVFLVKAGRLLTPGLDCGILDGLTRELVLEIARSGGIPCEEGRYGRDAVEQADEVFVTSTTREILPVARLDGRPVGAGSRGPVTGRLQELFRRRVERELGASPAAGTAA